MLRKFLRIFVNNGCSRHVCTTLDVATACETCGQFRWVARNGRLRRMTLEGMADGPGGPGAAVAGYLLDGRSVAEGEVPYVDGRMNAVHCFVVGNRLGDY